LEIEAVSAILMKDTERVITKGAYLYVLLRANPEAFLEAKKMARKPTYEEVFTKAGLIPEWIERGVEKGIEQGREEGIKKGREEGIEEGIEEDRKQVLELIEQGYTTEQLKAKLTEKPHRQRGNPAASGSNTSGVV
jgi:flagellar biosynthesis/type III secretory pathway protein FliH